MITIKQLEEVQNPAVKKAIETNRKLMEKLTGIKEPKTTTKKKGKTKIKKIYSIFPKVAVSIVIIVSFGSLLASIFVPDVVHVIMAIIENFDPFGSFRGNGTVNPDNYVMIIK